MPRTRLHQDRLRLRNFDENDGVTLNNNDASFNVDGWKPWFLVIAAAFVVRAPFLFYFGMSNDAYNNALTLPTYGFLASQGRPGAFVLLKLLDGLGAFGPICQYVDILIAVPLLCISAVLLWRSALLWSGKARIAVMLGAVMFVAHPYQAEILTFRDAAPFYAVSTLLGCAGYYLAVAGGRRKFVLGVLMIVAGLTIYQTFLNFLAIIWLMTVLFAYVAPEQIREFTRADLRRIIRTGFVAMLAAGIFYFGLTKVLGVLTGTHRAARAQLIAASDIPARIDAVMAIISGFMHGDLIASAPIASVVTTALAVGGMLVYLLFGRGIKRIVVVPLIFVLLTIASVGVIVFGQGFWPMPRVLVGYAMLPAFGAISLLLILRRLYWQRLLVSLCAVLLVSYTAIGATVAADQVRVNQRDMVLAAALAGRMALEPHVHIAMIGGPSAGYGIKTKRGDMNSSAYWPLWSKAASLSEFFGYPLNNATPAEYVRAQAYCAAKGSIWPAIDSVGRLDGNLAVVCFTRQ